MRKVLIVGSVVFLVIAPGFVSGLAPWWLSRWRVEAPFFGMPLFRFVRGILIALATLTATFGSEYKLFRAAVPRWIPPFTAWRSHPVA